MKLKHLNITFIGLICLFPLTNQAQQNWYFSEKLVNEQNFFNAIIDEDSSLILPVFDWSQSGKGFQLVKLKQNADILWKRTYQYQGEDYTWNKIIAVKNGYFLLGGSTLIDSQVGDPFLVKLNTCFEPEWHKVFHITDYNFLRKVIEVNDSLLILQSFYLNRDYSSLLLYDIKHNTINKKLTVDANSGQFIKVGDQLYIYGGAYIPKKPGSITRVAKATLYKATDMLEPIWSKHYYPDDTLHFTLSRGLIKLTQNNFIALIHELIPNITDPKADDGTRLFKVDSSGRVMKNEMLSDTNLSEIPTHITKINDNLFAISANHYRNLDNLYSLPHVYLVDSNLHIIKDRVIDPEIIGFDTNTAPNYGISLEFLEVSADNRLYIGGNYYNKAYFYDAFVLKLDLNLDVAQVQPDNGIYDTHCPHVVRDSFVQLPPPDTIYLYSDSFPLTPMGDYPMEVPAAVKSPTSSFANLLIYPNPAKGRLTVQMETPSDYRVKILDARLKECGIIHFRQQDKLLLDMSRLSEGLYWLEISDLLRGITSFEKVILE